MPPTATHHRHRLTVPASRRPPAPGGGGVPGRQARLLTALGRATPALCGYLTVRLLGLLVLARWVHVQGHGLWPTLAASWDSHWYLGIADHGYQRELGTELDSNNLAFFPLYPLLIKAAAAVTPGSRASVALVLAALASLAAAWGVFAVGDRVAGRRTGTVLALLWGASPVGIVQWMGYTESLFTALTAWSLYAALQGRWLWAGWLAVLAGLTRPTGIAVAAAVSVCALLAYVRAREWRALAGALIAPLGWCGFVAWVGQRVGRWDGYFAVQRLWRNPWDGGRRTLWELRQNLAYDASPMLWLVLVSLVLIVSVGLYALCLMDRQPLVLVVFTGVLLLVVLGSGGVYFPRARFLMPAFPLLLPIAAAVARARRPVAVMVLGGAALMSAWLGAYQLLVWTGPP
ncbi:mannosyltransferase family protein [Streptomyces sp. NPDC007861]|uniref:mannosyltransferase family protein n=1 Tax=Streptomyces sp. NPDC007861 TaxID=3154893 RepID=UPI0033CB870E